MMETASIDISCVETAALFCPELLIHTPVAVFDLATQILLPVHAEHHLLKLLFSGMYDVL
jgi:hypothetical protein